MMPVISVLRNRAGSRFRPFTWALVAWVTLAGAAVGQEPPFDGQVTADKVNVRSGAGDTHYVVLSLDAGARVKVLRNLYGWYEIVPPAGTFSYIAREDVRLNTDGKSGVIVNDRSPVRAPSPAGADAGASFKIQVKLEKGAAVSVLGEAGEFYKIVPPPGASLWVHRDFVKEASGPAPEPQRVEAAEDPATTTPPQRTTAVEPDKSNPKAEPEPAPEPEAPAKSQWVVNVTGDGELVLEDEVIDVEALTARLKSAEGGPQSVNLIVRGEKDAKREAVVGVIEAARAAGVVDVALAPIEPVAVEATEPEPVAEAPETTSDPGARSTPRLEDIESRYRDASKQPLLEQPLDELRIAYEGLLAEDSLGPSDQAAVKGRLRVIEYRRELQSKLGEVRSVRQQLDLARKEREEEARRRPKTYTVVGRLQASTLYTGEKLPLLYRVSDPSTGLTIAYVRPDPNDDFAEMIGQFVGVLGEKDLDPTLGLNVVKATGMDVLRPQQ